MDRRLFLKAGLGFVGGLLFGSTKAAIAPVAAPPLVVAPSGMIAHTDAGHLCVISNPRLRRMIFNFHKKNGDFTPETHADFYRKVRYSFRTRPEKWKELLDKGWVKGTLEEALNEAWRADLKRYKYNKPS